MKRSAPLTRRAGLSRRSRLARARPKPPLPEAEREARAAWKDPCYGRCECGCEPRAFSWHLERHHVVSAEKLREIKRTDVMWDLRNSMLLVEQHHHWHTTARYRIRLAAVPPAAREFAVEVLGEDGALLYFARYYGVSVAL